MRNRVITKCVMDMETLQWIPELEESFPYNGKWGHCLGGIGGGASSSDKSAEKTEQNFMSTMQNEQSTQFANEQVAQQQVQNAWSPIVSGGAYQYGFSTAEDQQLQANIENAGAQATQNTVAAEQLRQQQETGGADSAPSGANAALEAQVRATGAQQTATNIGNEKLAGYEQGANLFQEGTKAEEDVAQLANPTGYANSGASLGEDVNAANKQIDTANANSLTSKLLGGAIAGAASFIPGIGPALSQGMEKSLGGGSGNNGGNSGGGGGGGNGGGAGVPGYGG